MVWIVNPEYVPNSSLLATGKKDALPKRDNLLGTHAMAFMGCKGDHLQINKCSCLLVRIFQGNNVNSFSNMVMVVNRRRLFF